MLRRHFTSKRDVFLDIERAFYYTYDSMCDAVVKHRCDNTIFRWIRATLEGCVVAAILNISSMRVVVYRWCQ